MEPGRGQMDGLGTKAGQTRRVQSFVARRPGYQLPRAHRRRCATEKDPLRNHARLRHSIATRRCAQARRGGNPPAESAGDRRGDKPRHFRLRHPATTRQHCVVERVAFEVCPDLFRLHGNRSLHNRSIRRLPGLLRRRKLYRQGFIRRRRFSKDTR